jgi:hypothetical protein
MLKAENLILFNTTPSRLTRFNIFNLNLNLTHIHGILKIVVCVCVLMSSSWATAAASDSDTARHILIADEWFNAGNWCRPLWADMHSTISKAEFAFAPNRAAYDWLQLTTGTPSADYRPFLFANIGIDIPLWAGSFNQNRYSLSFSIPYFVNLWMDAFETRTGAIINTDYRIGTPEILFISRINKRWLKNYSLRISFLKHESTHIGDELTIARANAGLQITRINVSYEAWSAEFMLNDPEFSLSQNHAFKVGAIGYYKKKGNWYTIPKNATENTTLSYSEGNPTLVRHSRIPMEIYLQYQYQSPYNFARHYQWIASAELRLRPRYDYPMDEPSLQHSGGIVPCLNTMLGIRFRNPALLKNRAVGFALHGYYGLNPHGQFRALTKHSQLGLMMVIE